LPFKNYDFSNVAQVAMPTTERRPCVKIIIVTQLGGLLRVANLAYFSPKKTQMWGYLGFGGSWRFLGQLWKLVMTADLTKNITCINWGFSAEKLLGIFFEHGLATLAHYTQDDIFWEGMARATVCLCCVCCLKKKKVLTQRPHFLTVTNRNIAYPDLF
jgi:hypothetical protein